MALIRPSGSAPTSSAPSETSYVKDNVAEIKDTYINRTSISPEKYSDIYGTLLGYADGTPIELEYYRMNFPMRDKQTGEVDLSTIRHSVHKDLTLIHDFEVRLDGELQITYDEETTEMSIVGRAVTYPEFAPNIGDVFLYVLPDQQIGIFIVNNIQRLSITRGSSFAIDFHLVAFASEEIETLEKLNSSVSEEVHFDKQKYLSKGSVLLTSTSYNYLRDLRKYRNVLTQYFFQVFYDQSLKTVLRPDGAYDPYIVEFLHAKVSVSEIPNRPWQLYPEATNHFSSIWFLLTDAVHIDLSMLQYTTFRVLHTNEIWDAGITALINREMIYLDDRELLNAKKDLLIIKEDVEDPAYVLSSAFYSGEEDSMSDFEKIMYKAINTKEIDIGVLIETYLKPFRTLPIEDQFYRICLYLYLIDMAIHNIT